MRETVSSVLGLRRDSPPSSAAREIDRVESPVSASDIGRIPRETSGARVVGDFICWNGGPRQYELTGFSSVVDDPAPDGF